MYQKAASYDCPNIDPELGHSIHCIYNILKNELISFKMNGYVKNILNCNPF